MPTQFTKTIEILLDNKKYSSLRDVLATMNEADIADMFSDIGAERLPLLFRLLPKDLAADTFAHMESDGQELLIRGFSDNEIKEVFDELYVDDAADIIEEMPANVVKRILKNTDPELRKTINEILKYPEDSAGSLMTTDYISLRPNMTISEAIKRIRRSVNEAETIYTCYVTDNNRTLLGYLSVRDILLSQPDDKVCDIMDKTVICVRTLDDKEFVANEMSRYDFVAMPVVDDEGRLVGIVTFDDAIDVMQEEATEDIERMAAISHSEETYFKTSDFTHAKNRVLWLLILMISSALIGVIIARYESAFEAIPSLVAFIPMLMSTGGNSGSQSSTMIIRGMSVDEIKLRDFFKVVFTEFRISLVISIVLALVNGVRIWITGSLELAIVVSLSIIVTVVAAQLIGCMLPMLAKRCKLDPAVMASPLITTIVDATSVLVYFSIATRFFDLM